MRKTSLATLFLIIAFAANAQQSTFKIAKNYYRADPFAVPFSTFLTKLLNDPAAKDISLHKKTDSTLFYFTGNYLSHKPFFFPGIGTKITLAEREVVIADTVDYLKSYYVYQLIGYAPEGEDGLKDVKEEYAKFLKKYKKDFPGASIQKIKEAKGAEGEITNFHSSISGFYPLAIAWSSSDGKKENLFAVTISFWVTDNTAWLPIPADGF